MKVNKKYIIASLITIFGIAGGILTGLKFNISSDESGVKTEVILDDYSIEFALEQISTIIETKDGDIEVISAPTIESIDSGNINCENGSECGMGKFIYAPTATPFEFKDYTINKCWDTDDFPDGAKAQCWDLGDLFWQNYAGRNLSTCGTGAAKGAWDCKEYNAGDEFELITDPKDIQIGDWIIFNSGRWGHVGMAMGGYNDGYVALLGQNQGGQYCDEGGQAANIINISLNSFSGAFRPKSYIKHDPEPEPEIPISGCDIWHVVEGDTMSGIMLQCENVVVYGEAMDNYAKSWYSLFYKPNQSVYDGWHSESGVGLYSGDDIEHRIK